LEDYASGKALLFNRDKDNAATYFVQARENLLDMKRLDKTARAKDFKFTPRRDVHASRRQRRAV
jgi:hypothetical protein